MPRWLIWLVAVLVVWCWALDPAFAGKRVALVVGNGAYQHVAGLPNPTRDAADLANALRGIGFEVKELENADKVAFEAALSDFSDAAAGADFAIVYYAGHGIEVDRQNYLIPVDAKLATDRRLRFEALSLDDVLGALDGVKGIRMVLLDACRNNPFSASMTMTSASRSIGRGLSRVEAASGTVISFAAKEGTTASDGDGRNSPFTAALLANISEPGLEIQFLLRDVRDRVLSATNGAQEPFISASLPREAVYLVPPLTSGISTDVSGNVTSPASDPVAVDYQLAERVGNAEAWEAFLAKHGSETGNFYVDLAKAARQKLATANSSSGQNPAAEPEQQQVAAVVSPAAGVEKNLTRDLRLRIEIALMKQSIEPGNIDGEFDRDTRAGIKSWQYVSGFEPTGTLEQSQIDNLLGTAGSRDVDTSRIAMAYKQPPEGADGRLIHAINELRGLSFTHGSFGGHLYLAVIDNGDISFKDARELAKRAGGALACVSSAAENNAIFDLIKEDLRFWRIDNKYDFISGPWIGLYQAPGSRSSKQGWVWVDGCKSSYRNWKGGQPNEIDLNAGPGAAAYGGNGKKATAAWQDPILFKQPAPGLIIEIE